MMWSREGSLGIGLTTPSYILLSFLPNEGTDTECCQKSFSTESCLMEHIHTGSLSESLQSIYSIQREQLASGVARLYLANMST